MAIPFSVDAKYVHTEQGYKTGELDMYFKAFRPKSYVIRYFHQVDLYVRISEYAWRLSSL